MLEIDSRAAITASARPTTPPTLSGPSAFTDAAHESPGIRRHLTVADMPAPAPNESVDNGPTLVPRPANA